jgi:hypothetical protein
VGVVCRTRNYRGNALTFNIDYVAQMCMDCFSTFPSVNKGNLEPASPGAHMSICISRSSECCLEVTEN